MQVFYALSFLVILRLALPFFPTSEWSLSHWIQRGIIGENSPTLTAAIAHTHKLTPAAPIEHSFTWREAAAMLWISGLAVGGVFLLGSYVRLRRWLRYQPLATDPDLLHLIETCRSSAGVSFNVPVHLVNRMCTPAVFGFLKPRILIPEKLVRQLEPQDLKHILIHEFTHIRRHDMLVGTLATAVAVFEVPPK